ncbi:MAG: hypothetical protein JKX85_02655 [Phycisphaeraceae bacterium]|nr:hypothetical protein [Phycisphaeraceae bacterium]
MQNITIPKSNAQSHERMLGLMLQASAPIKPAGIICAGIPIGRSNDGNQQYRIALARQQELEHLSKSAKAKGAKRVRFTVNDAYMEKPIYLISPFDQLLQKMKTGINFAAIILTFGSFYWFGNAWEQFETQQLAIAKTLDNNLGQAARQAITQERSDAAARDALAAAPMLRRPGKAIFDITTLNELTPINAYWRNLDWNPNELVVQLNATDGASVVRIMSQNNDYFTIEVISDIAATNQGRQSVRIRAVSDLESGGN